MYIKISQKPTFDVEQIEIVGISKEDQIIFVKSKQIFKFNGVYGMMQNRSRVLRQAKEESSLVENIIVATIDAGFCGYLFWKIKLTKKGLNLFENITDLNSKAEAVVGCQQIHLSPTPNQDDYYDGTNQTALKPDITFLV
jgi:hypothetical protein